MKKKMMKISSVSTDSSSDTSVGLVISMSSVHHQHLHHHHDGTMRTTKAMYRPRSTGSLELVSDAENTDVTFDKLVQFEKTFRDPEEKMSTLSKIPGAIRKSAFGCNLKKYIFGLFPIIKTFRNYQIKEDLPNDFIGGVTAGVLMIPQGMAFGALSTLTPIVGLYVCFFSSVSYFIFGTCRHISWGAIAILSLMMANVLDKYDLTQTATSQIDCVTNSSALQIHNNSTFINVNITRNATMNNNTLSSRSDAFAADQLMARRVEFASGVTFLSGLVLILASRLGLSKLTNIMSNSLITGFLVGASIHVSTSQLKGLFGLEIPRLSGLSSVPRTWVEILINIPDTNPYTVSMSAACVFVIYMVKRFVNEKYKSKLRVPVPIEILVVIVATVISTYAKLQDKFDVIVVKDVPVGLPAPTFPDMVAAKDYIGDGIVIIIVAYAQTVALAKTFGLKHNYHVDPNQEMLACGAGSVICGIFSGYIPAPSVSRSIVQDGAGGRTQVASLFAALMVLLVIMVLGPYLYHLPTCVLSAIIIVSLRSMFLKLLDIPKEWRKSRYDCAVWVFTCAATVFLSADMGLLAGVIFSVFLVVYRSMVAPVIEVGKIPNGDSSASFRSLNHYSSARTYSNVKIIKIKTALYFVNSDLFTSQIVAKTGIDPISIKKKNNRKIRNLRINTSTLSDNGVLFKQRSDEIKFILLDASEVSFIDEMGVQALQFVISEFHSVDKEVLIASVPEGILPMLKSTGFWDRNGELLFLSLEAALAYTITAQSSTHKQDNTLTNL